MAIETIRRTIPAVISEMGPRQVRVRAATRNLGRDMLIVHPEGIGLDHYRANPVMLWQHKQEFPVARATTIGVEGGDLCADVDFAPSGISDKADEICGLVKAGIINAVSIGFRALEDEPVDKQRPNGPRRVVRSELTEISFVSVPADREAIVLQRGDKTISTASGELAEKRRTEITSAGKIAAPSRLMKATPMTISKQIEDTQAKLNAARDALTEHTRDPEYAVDEAELLQSQIEAHEQRLASLQRTERALAIRTAQQPPPQQIEAPTVMRRPLGIPQKDIAPADLLFRAMAVKVTAEVQHRSVDAVLQERYPDHEGTAGVTRAAIAGASTVVAGWAAELAVLAQADFLATLVPTNVFPRLAAEGVSLTFGPNSAAIKIPSRAPTPSIGGSFVGEGLPIPVRRFQTQSITLNPHKVGGLSVFSREIAMYSNPQIEGLIRAAVTEDSLIIVDGLLLDNNAVSTVRPAGLTNGVTPITASTAHAYTAILADLQALSNPFFLANAGRKLCLLINPIQGQQLAFAAGPQGVPFGWTTQFTSRYRVIESTSIPANQVYMVDAADFVSVAGAPEFEVSEQATLHMEDTTPLQLATGAQGSGVLATPQQSMFQTASIAIRMLMNITWAMRRAGMVQFMTGVNWGP